MLLKYFYDDALAQASYMVGCAATGEALVVDPSRDIQRYLDVAESEGLQITHVTETHIHADYVSGSRELAAATGATIYLSDEGDADWKYGYADDDNVTLVTDGDAFMVGNVKAEVLHTPGHTPEHISIMITDTASADQPMGVFTGDFIFVGDVGRPDLLEEAAGVAGTKEPGARQMFQSLERFKDMPDYLQILPGHGAGSACGKALSAVPSTTLGYEKLFNPAFQYDNEDAFVDWLLDGQPEAPFYFAQMKRVNKEGPALLDNLTTPQCVSRTTIDEALDASHVVLDLRAADDFADAHLPNTINIPMTSTGYVNYVGWFVDYDAPLYVILPEGADPDDVTMTLRTIGVDNLPGYAFAPDVITGRADSLAQITTDELTRRMATDTVTVVDVRGKSEYDDQHMSDAIHIPLGYLMRDAADQLPTDTTLVTHCASGYRSMIAASALRRMGYEDVISLKDSVDVWSQAVPVV